MSLVKVMERETMKIGILGSRVHCILSILLLPAYSLATSLQLAAFQEARVTHQKV